VRRLAVVNRGEPALRLIRAVAELNAEHRSGLRVIAMHTEAERGRRSCAPPTRRSCCGAPVTSTPTSTTTSWRARCGVPCGRRVGRLGLRGEDPAFAELCASLGVVFVGPPAEAMRRLGDKVEAKLLAEATGVPVAPWSGGPVLDVEDGRKHAAHIGYPLIVKARSGGGGRGIRIVRAEHELDEALERTQSEALRPSPTRSSSWSAWSRAAATSRCR
jgi:biotin carboxylase